MTRAAVHPLSDDPVLPEPRTVYWVDTSILPGADPEARRPVVVVAVPDDATGTVTVAVRSGGDGFGVKHPAGGPLGFSGPGRFSRRLPVPRQLWTATTVTPVGPLEDAVFAAVVARFTV